MNVTTPHPIRAFHFGLLIWTAWLASCGAVHVMASGPSTVAPLNAASLLHYRDATGAIQPVKTVQDWERRRASIAQRMEQVMGPFPEEKRKWPVRMDVLGRVDCGSYYRLSITYVPEPRALIPAYLLVPKTALDQGQEAPAVLCLHPTDDEVGNRVVVGLSRKTNRDYAMELAERGFVTLAPAYPLLANYHPDLDALGYTSGVMKAIWDNVRGLDLLESLPYVKKGAFGAIGHSLGGHNALFTAVFDPRIKVIVSSCGFDSFQDYMDGDIRGWTSKRYMPELLKYSLAEIPFDFHEVLGALAPRDVFISAPFYDSNFKWRSVFQIRQSAEEVYKLYGAQRRLVVEHPNCGHDFPVEIRQKAYQLFESRLN